MDDLDTLLAVRPRPGGKECATGWAIGRLSPEEAEKVRAILSLPMNRERARDLAAALARRDLGYASVESIIRHAKGDCRKCAERPE